MKHTILISLILFLFSCKKEPKERYITLIAIGFNAELDANQCNDDKCVGDRVTLVNGVDYSYWIREGYKGNAKVKCEKVVNNKKVPNEDFSLKVIENGKVIYHKDGAYHELKF